MGKILIVAEKPAQAREYASALGVRGKGQGYLENETYIITWCIGHLLELEKPEAYMDFEKVGKRWSLQRLPVLPGIGDFRRVVKPGTRKQYQVLKSLLQSRDVEQVICATDADREGQLLFQEVWDLVQCTKPLSRLWISSLTKEAVREGFKRLLPGQQVAGLAEAGYGRAYADWDFGMNLTEGFTSLFGSFDPVRKKPNVISIGRVQTPTLALIVERELEIENFVREDYFEVRATFAASGGSYSGRWFNRDSNSPRLASREQAEAIAAKTAGSTGSVMAMEQKKVPEHPPLLFDLTSLTVAASRRFGFSAEKVLELAQALYDKKAITYPRTDCAYLPNDMAPKLPAHLSAVSTGDYADMAREAAGYGVPKGKRVINTITAHHAIIPTTETVNTERLSEPERKIYDLIIRRFLAVWYPPAWYEQTEIITEAAHELFRTKGRVLLSAGWKKVYGAEEDAEAAGEGVGAGAQRAADAKKTKRSKRKSSADEDADENTELPAVQKGETVRTTETAVEEKSTKPPKRYTQGDLLKAMEGAGKQIEDDVLRQQMKGKGLGTVATRPAIIENLLERGYIEHEQKALKPTRKGMELIKLIKERLPNAALLISAEMTGQLEYDLARVERKELTLAAYMHGVETEIIRIIDELRGFEQQHGKMPLALAPGRSRGGPSGVGARKTRRQRPAGTAAKTGKRSMPAETLAHSSAVRPEETAEKTVRKATAKVAEKTARKATAKTAEKPARKATVETVGTSAGEIVAAANNDRVAAPKESLGACPRCGADIIEGRKGYGCTRWREGCAFVIWKNPICGKVLTAAQVRSLLKKGKTPQIKGFKSKSGKSFAASLTWDDKENGKLRFDFS